MTIGSPNFKVTIFYPCTGWEGTALMLVFSVSWLWILHREYRFPQALLLVPAAMVTMWVANALRIALLIVIGAAGAPHVALDGFHSEAGWIAFNCVALGFAVLSRKVPWFTVQAPEPAAREALSASPTAAHLLPFLAILAAGMISRAASSGFEWLYPLRLIAAAAALWFFRAQYSRMDWKCSWLSFVLGSLVFLIWLTLYRFNGVQTDPSTALGLASWPGFARITWVLCRVAAAVVTVPLAEELAFRGFLIRRLLCRGFDSLHPQAFTVVAVLLSSILFGLLHGTRWLAGTMAGLIYAVAFLRRGRIGDAVVAHATTNAWLALWVLGNGDWSLW
jgi:exosortase E/protease (VPEID-CTERM system)